MDRFKRYMNIFLLFISALLIVSSVYVRITQPTGEIDEYLYCLMYGLENGDFAPLFDALKYCVPVLVLLVCIFVNLVYSDKIFTIEKRGKLKWFYDRKKITISVIFIGSILITLHSLSFFLWSYDKVSSSTFIDRNYVEVEDVKITAPKKKKNLVFIFLESFETTVMDKKSGGSFDENIVPELTELVNDKNSVIFKTLNGKVGASSITGAKFTTASVFTNNTATPFKVYVTKKLTEDSFMSGAYSLGDFLNDNGYHNELISSAVTSFGGFKEYFNNHGKYDIIDIDDYMDYGLEITDDDLHPWGFNDNYLFETAKKRLDVLASGDKPFNLTLVGIDTHFPNGFEGKYTIKEYDNKLSNSYRTESKLVVDFINWIKTKDYYKDTVICIVGDHLSMANQYFRNVDLEDRKLLVAYINTNKKDYNAENRVYTALDTYPTILSALDFDISGNRLGLGTNMFSKEPTTVEKYGLKKVDAEIRKKSKYYEENIIEK